jgi:hypothetical protein
MVGIKLAGPAAVSAPVRKVIMGKPPVKINAYIILCFAKECKGYFALF